MRLSLIAGSSNVPLAQSIGEKLGVRPCTRTDERFDDGELHVEVEESLRGHDVYVIQPTSPPADEHLMELIFLADACRRAGADRLTAVVPYFGYARQDRRVTGRTPVGARVVAGLLEHAGFARIVSVDLHTPAIEGFFHTPLEHLSATGLLAEGVPAKDDMIIVAPDLGAMRLAERYQSRLNLPIAVIHKARAGGSGVTVRRLIGDVKARAPLIVDDMITTGGTIEAAARGLLEAGCSPNITVAATHGLFVGPAAARLDALPLAAVITTDSVIPATSPLRVHTISLAPILADVIVRLHGNKSLNDLLVRA